jgi:hypothetical protein
MTSDADAILVLSQLNVELARAADADLLAAVLGQYLAIAAARIVRRRTGTPLPSAVSNPWEQMTQAQMQLKLQMAMDRRSKMMSTLSNIMKKISDEANTIVTNLK